MKGYENPGGPVAEEINGFRIFPEAKAGLFSMTVDLTGIAENSASESETNQ